MEGDPLVISEESNNAVHNRNNNEHDVVVIDDDDDCVILEEDKRSSENSHEEVSHDGDEVADDRAADVRAADDGVANDGVANDDDNDVEFIREVRPPPRPESSHVGSMGFLGAPVVFGIPVRSPSPPLPEPPRHRHRPHSVFHDSRSFFPLSLPPPSFFFSGPFVHPTMFDFFDGEDDEDYHDEEEEEEEDHSEENGLSSGWASAGSHDDGQNDDVVFVGANHVPPPVIFDPNHAVVIARGGRRGRRGQDNKSPPSKRARKTGPTIPRGAKFRCSRESLEEESCAICLTPLLQVDVIVRSKKCGHMFCLNCINEWLSRYNKICPLCKGSFLKSHLQHVVVLQDAKNDTKESRSSSSSSSST